MGLNLTASVWYADNDVRENYFVELEIGFSVLLRVSSYLKVKHRIRRIEFDVKCFRAWNK